MRTGGIGGSLLLVAIGAVLYWGVSAEAEGMDLSLIGLILLIVGGIGLVITMFMTAGNSDKDVTIIDR